MIDPASIPYLPRGVRLHHCEVRGAWLLLAPERAVKLDTVAAAILQSIDGARSLASIVDHLAEAFQSTDQQIAADVQQFLTDLINRRMIEIRQ